MKLDELKATNSVYKENIEMWELYGLAYEGGKKFIDYCLKWNSRESIENWRTRQEEGCSFNFASSIVDLLNFYLTDKQPVRYMAGLDKNELWNMFLKDCDYTGTNYDTFINEAQKFASVYGAVGILINKANVNFEIRQQEIDNSAYPYLTLYTPPNILDWAFMKNEVGRPQLAYLKLRDSENRYIIWTKDAWYVYEIDERNNVILLDQGENRLGAIPFVWSLNIKNATNPIVGTSDIKEISHIVASICRNISAGDEVIKYAGFPMLRLPKAREDAMEKGGDILVAPNGVLEFDPEQGDKGKPDWLESKILEPIEAVLNWTDRKADEIFRICHLSGVHGQRKSNNEVASGLALRYESQQLNSLLNKKATQMCETELSIIKFFLMWQNQYDLFKDITIMRKREFAVDDLSVSLDINLKAIDSLRSKVFALKVKQNIARQILPDLTDEEYDQIEKEINTSFDKEDLSEEESEDVSKDMPENQKTPNASVVEKRAAGNRKNK